jgi:riboflavin kinase/FMN adenylyltransferase
MAMHLLPWHEPPPMDCRHGAMAIGNFDGVHRGHAALVEETCRQARALSGPALVLTFDPHPVNLLKPLDFLPVLTTTSERARLLQSLGVDHVVFLHTTLEMLALTAEEFFTRVVREHFHVRVLVEGEYFGFGRERSGNLATLAELCRRDGMALIVVPPVMLGGTRVSSSRVRSELDRGAIREAVECLGRPYRLSGTVAAGQRRGQTLGFPTANLERTTTVVPGDGVYAVAVLHEGTTWPGACNIGPNPTFGEQARKVEVHLIGFQGDLYGRPLTMDFLDRLRDTRPFASAADLRAQLSADIERARRIFEERKTYTAAGAETP